MRKLNLAGALILAVAMSCFATGVPASEENTMDAQKVYDVEWLVGFWGNEVDPHGYFAEKLNDTFNVNMTMNYLPMGALAEKYQLLVMSGDLPDVLMLKDADANYIKWARQGVFADVTDYWSNYPNLNREISDKIIDRGPRVDGRIYGIPCNWRDMGRGIITRSDWLDKSGLGIPRTPDDFLEVAKYYTYGDPDGDGEDDTYAFGLSTDMEQTMNMFGATFHVRTGEGGEFALDLVDGEPVLFYMKPGYRDLIMFLRKAWEEGVIDPGTITMKGNAVTQMIRQGKTGFSSMNMTAHYGVTEEAVQQDDPNAGLIALEPFVDSRYGTPEFTTKKGWFRMEAIASSAEQEPGKVETILSIFDWMLSDEGWQFMEYGVPGVHSELVDGVWTKTGYDDDNWSNLRIILKPRGFQYDLSPFIRDTDLGQKIIAAVDMYGGYAHDKIYLPEEPAAIDTASDCQRIRLEGMFEIITGERPMEDFDSIMAEWMKRGGALYLEQAKEILSHN